MNCAVCSHPLALADAHPRVADLQLRTCRSCREVHHRSCEARCPERKQPRVRPRPPRRTRRRARWNYDPEAMPYLVHGNRRRKSLRHRAYGGRWQDLHRKLYRVAQSELRARRMSRKQRRGWA